MNRLSLTAIQLKWIAIITMTIDHFGVIVLYPYVQIEAIAIVYTISRLIGRIAFPLFAFMIAEGMNKTRNPFNYYLRLLFMAILIGLAMAIMGLIGLNALAGNIFIDLSMAALMMLFLKQKPWIFKFLALVPISYVVTLSVMNNAPNFLRPDYGIYGLLMMALFFLSLNPPHWLEKMRMIPRFAWGENATFSSTENRYQRASVLLLIFHLVWYIVYLVMQAAIPVNDAVTRYLAGFVGAQSYAILAAFWIYRYHGEKGKTPHWFQIFTYLYYPLHFVVLYGLYLLTTV